MITNFQHSGEPCCPDNHNLISWCGKDAADCPRYCANPPYSRATYHGKQAVTGMVHIMEYADHVAFIRGRIGFDLPDWFIPANEKQKSSGAFFAGAVVILDKDWQGEKISYISRDELIAIGELFMRQAYWLVEKTGEAA